VLDDLESVVDVLTSRPDTASRTTAWEAPDSARAAVLVPLLEVTGRTGVVLTRRAAHLRRHAGEVSFPGGRMEPGESPWDTALREAHEEIALDPALVSPVGRLDPVNTRVSGNLIHPVVGRVTGAPVLSADPGEVARIFTVTLSDLAREGTHWCEDWGTPDGTVSVHFFAVDGETVWGATARMLHTLIGALVAPGQGPA
jgi:8-oxo-dGTP pyrophosphatase MutT (NUDIX family)